jgi:hypothetical protein
MSIGLSVTPGPEGLRTVSTIVGSTIELRPA